MTAPATTRLSRAQARRLTERIRHAGLALQKLLLKAHDGQAWKPLGYHSWKAYLSEEFGITERSGFRMLDQAKVAKELSAAAGEPVEVSQRQAATVKPHLEEAVQRVESGESAATVVEDLAKPPTPAERATVPKPAVDDPPLTETYPQDPAPRQPGEGVAEPRPATPDPVPPAAPSGGEGTAPRARAALLSAGFPPSTEPTPSDLARTLVAMSMEEWRTIDVMLAAELATACRRRITAPAKKPPAMKAAKPGHAPVNHTATARRQAALAKDCRHPLGSRIGSDFCGACSTKIKASAG